MANADRRSFENVPHLFSDLVASRRLRPMSPGALIDILSTVFARFHRAVADHGLERQDDCDAYMFAADSGAIGRTRARVADLALEMLEIVSASPHRDGYRSERQDRHQHRTGHRRRHRNA